MKNTHTKVSYSSVRSFTCGSCTTALRFKVICAGLWHKVQFCILLAPCIWCLRGCPVAKAEIFLVQSQIHQKGCGYAGTSSLSQCATSGVGHKLVLNLSYLNIRWSSLSLVYACLIVRRFVADLLWPVLTWTPLCLGDFWFLFSLPQQSQLWWAVLCSHCLHMLLDSGSSKYYSRRRARIWPCGLAVQFKLDLASPWGAAVQALALLAKDCWGTLPPSYNWLELLLSWGNITAFVEVAFTNLIH